MPMFIFYTLVVNKYVLGPEWIWIIIYIVDKVIKYHNETVIEAWCNMLNNSLITPETLIV